MSNALHIVGSTGGNLSLVLPIFFINTPMESVMATKKQVVQAWQSGHVASTPNRTFHTDGSSLYSYNLRIGYKEIELWIDGDGYEDIEFEIRIVLDYTSPHNFVSQTTSCHVGEARKVADRMEVPA